METKFQFEEICSPSISHSTIQVSASFSIFNHSCIHTSFSYKDLVYLGGFFVVFGGRGLFACLSVHLFVVWFVCLFVHVGFFLNQFPFVFFIFSSLFFSISVSITSFSIFIVVVTPTTSAAAEIVVVIIIIEKISNSSVVTLALAIILNFFSYGCLCLFFVLVFFFFFWFFLNLFIHLFCEKSDPLIKTLILKTHIFNAITAHTHL